MSRFFHPKGIIRRRDVEIAPEEVFMDSVNIHGFRHEMQEGRIERPIPARSFIIFAFILMLGFLVLASRLGILGIVERATLRASAESNKTYPILIAAPRGIFYDRDFRKLVENTPTFTISLFREDFSDDASFARALGRLALASGKNVRDVAHENDRPDELSDQALGSRASWPRDIFIASGELTQTVLDIQTHAEQYPGVRIKEGGRREYPLGQNAAHLIGYVGRPTEKDLLVYPNISTTDIVGKAGLELQYEIFLEGASGQKIVEVNASGEAQRERFIEKATAGKDIQLEIDAGLQEFAGKALIRNIAALGKRAGAIVVMDPRDGAIRAIASYPSFDPNMFARGLSRSEFNAIFSNPTNPLFDRAISGAYPSGSTIKPLMATAALEERLIDPKKTINDIGYISVPNPYDKNKPTIFKDWKALGVLDMRRAIAWSANVYFYSIGGGYGDIPGLGIERIGKWLAKFGWGSKLGIDLPGENGGMVPSPENKKITRPDDPIWRIGDTYISSIGQGDLQMNPLQLASAISAVANDGTLWKPRVAKAVVDQDRKVVREFKPEAIRTDIASHASFQVVREGMREAVVYGSAQALADLPVKAAGKTGTAQTGAYGKNHGWFVGFAPYENPELVVVVLVEQGTGGSTDAVPIAEQVLYYYYTRHAQATNSQLTPLENSNIIESTSTPN